MSGEGNGRTSVATVELPDGLVFVHPAKGGFMVLYDGAGGRWRGPFSLGQAQTFIWCMAQCHFRSTTTPYVTYPRAREGREGAS